MEGVQQVHEEVKPMLYRWISTSRSSANVKSDEKTMSISFSVPIIVDIPPLENKTSFKTRRGPAKCAVKGCAGTVKYKLVRDSSLGACGMAHLKCLEA